MRVFLTGATGFVGSALVRELVAAGHEVLGLCRSDAKAPALAAAGAEVHRGSLEDADSLRAGVDRAEAVIHTAFDHTAFEHDFTRFVDHCEQDRRVIGVLGEALGRSGRLLLVTSGTGMGDPGDGQPAREDVCNFDHPNPRSASEQAAQAMLDAGVAVSVVRLPQVHDTRRQGLISCLAAIAREKGFCAYIGEGRTCWPAAHVLDVARLYRLALERNVPGARYHAVAESGIAARDIARALASGLQVPVKSIAPDAAADYFGWLAPFAGIDMTAASDWTRQVLDWHPHGPGLVEDLIHADFARPVA